MHFADQLHQTSITLVNVVGACGYCLLLTWLTAHLGGLLMGLLVGMALYPIISPSLRHRSIVLALRVGAAALVVVLFVVLIRNFYTSNPYAGTYSPSVVADSASPICRL